jgi:hypothetical protein
MSARLAASGFDKDAQLKILLFPETLCGFAPQHFPEMLLRLNCPSCMQVMAIIANLVALGHELHRKVQEVDKPRRDENDRRVSEYENRCHRFWIVARFFKEPKLIPEPNYDDEPWHQEISKQIVDCMSEIDRLKAEDPDHWGSPAEEQISQELVTRFLHRNSIFCS